MRVGIIDLHLNNLLSVRHALLELGCSVEILDFPQSDLLSRVDLLVLPGVGHFAQAKRNLREAGFEAAIKDWLEANRPFLGICLGFQLLCASSEEGEEAGLSFFPPPVRRLPPTEKVPHMGWNSVSFEPPFHACSNHFFYFVHSFYVPPCEWTVGRVFYGFEFSAACARGNVMGVQFHPEKSQKSGLLFLQLVLKRLVHATAPQS